MISLKPKGLGFSSQGVKCFSIIQQRQKSHYDVLEITRTASQADVKSAYYKLSKMYHPDANINDPTATAKFQEISEAYEILGNDDMRMRYDKGMAPGGMTSIRPTKSKAPEDAKAAFYKSRLMNKMNKTNSPTAGRSYDFDEWTKQHYSANVISNRILKSQTSLRSNIKYSTTDKHYQDIPVKPNSASKNEIRAAVVLCTVILVAVLTYELDRPDSPRPKS